MILDLPRFLSKEHGYWEELERLLDELDADPYRKLSLAQVARLQYLYGRAVSALGKMATFSAETDAREYLESIVARAYAACYPHRPGAQRFRPWPWLTMTFPQTFRRRWQAFLLATALTLGGASFGAAALAIDRNAKSVLMPFANLLGSPTERVRQEERDKGQHLNGLKSRFSAQLMTHNIQVVFTTLAMGATWGIGSTVLLFYNGVTLGAVAADYASAGQSEFLLGWLLPHGVIEIPAILVAGQAGFVLASALIGWGDGRNRRTRLRSVSADVMTLAGGAALMLVWAGIVEAFLSQYHYPVLPYSAKIGFGLVEACALTLLLIRAGRAQ